MPDDGVALAANYANVAKHVFSDGAGDGVFRYTKQVLGGDVAIIEFQTTIDGTHVNGVDIIRCDATGRIVELRVMVGPLRAVMTGHAETQGMFERLHARRPGARRPPDHRPAF